MIELDAGDARVSIDPLRGGRVAAIEVSGLNLLVGRDSDPLLWGCYPMAPWAGRVRDGRFGFEGREHALPINLPPHAIHGTTFVREWSREGDDCLVTALGSDWPFAGRALQRFALDPDGLDLGLEVHAEDESFPASLGWHPWFRRQLGRGDPAELKFDARKMYLRDESGICDGALVDPPPGPWDDCFTSLVSAPRIRWPGAIEIGLTSSAQHWVVYDEPAHALCVEPQTGPPDALNIAPEVVAPGRPLVLTLRLEWRRL